MLTLTINLSAADRALLTRIAVAIEVLALSSAAVATLTAQLKQQTDPLAAAVAANQPTRP